MWNVAVETVRESIEDDAVGLSAQIAFYGIFSLFPFVIVLRSLEQYLPEGERVIPFVLSMLEDMTGGQDRVYQLAEQILQQAEQRQNSLLSFGVILSLWGASRGFGVVVKGINRAYDIEEKRGYITRRLFGLAITVVLIVLMFGGVIIAIFGRRVLGPLLSAIGIGFLPDTAVMILAWPVSLVLLLLGLAITYHFAPAKRGSWRWTTPGALFAVVAMLLLSLGLSLFIAQDMFKISWLTFSSLGVLLVIQLWMFLMGLAVVVGGEMNAVLDRGQHRETATAAGGPLAGERRDVPATDDEGAPVATRR